MFSMRCCFLSRSLYLKLPGLLLHLPDVSILLLLLWFPSSTAFVLKLYLLGACMQMAAPAPANGMSAAGIFQKYVKLCEETQSHVRAAHEQVKARTYETQQTKEGRQEMKLRMFIIMQVRCHAQEPLT